MSSTPTRVLRWSAQVVVLGLACVALARCGGGGDSGSGPSSATIALSNQTIAFAGVAGGANPVVQTVAVTNGGGGSLGGLSSSVSYGSAQPDGWLIASLSTSAAPSTLTLTPTTGVLVAGSYTATVAVASSAATNSPRLIDVTFTITTLVPTTPPAAPSGLGATGTSSSQINLAWTDNASNEAGFQIDRCDGLTCTNFALYALVGPNVVTYQDVGLTASTAFRYRVRAFNDIGNSAFSANASATTQAAAVVLPAAPTTLTATAASSSQINLAWTDNSSNETGFRLEGCAGTACTNFTEFALVVANVSTYQVTSLTSASDYTFRVRAYNDAGNSAYSNTATTFTLTEPPAAPTTLTATAFSSTQINLAWADNASNETGFRIDRCLGTSCTDFAEIATVGANVITYQNTGLSATTAYNYRVRAYNTGGTSAFTNSATATTPATPTVPAAPTTLTATAYSTTQIDLAWTDNATTETGFKIERCAGTTCSNFVEIATVGPNITSYSNTSLTASTGYNYRVRAYNETGNSTYSNSASATTLAAPAVPAAPTVLSATATSSSQINLAWTDNATTETGFKIERCNGTSCIDFVELTTVGANVTTYSNTGLPASTAYNYRVRAYNDVGNSTYSNSATATTQAPAVTPPAAPTSLTTTQVSSSQINLAWVDNATTETGFSIERCAGLSCSNFVELTTVGANVTTYQNTGLASETGYNYRVRAYNTGGNSGYSNTSATTTAGTAPAAPTLLSATTISSSQINLSWTDNASNESGFLIERCAGVSCSNFVEFASTTTNVTTYQNTSLAASTAYSYRVRAWNAPGTSAYTNTASATTQAQTIAPPAAPSNMTATDISTSVIDLAWTDNATTETGFSVEGCTGANCTNFSEIGTFGPNIVLVNANTLPQGTTYRFRVRAFNTGGYSAYSNIAQATTQTATTYLVQYDNMVAYSSANSTVQNNVYATGENAVGFNYVYTSTTLTGYAGAASLMYFDVQTAIAGKTILEAKLLLRELGPPPLDLLGTFKIAAMATTWNPSTINWTIWSTTSYYNDTWVSFGASSTTSVSSRVFDVLGIVQHWASGARPNYGFTLFDDLYGTPGYQSAQQMLFESLDYYNNTANRPQLYIRYR